MSLETADLARMLIALTLLVLVAHTMGYLFTRLRLPAVIGEILGGLLLGPTVLGAVAPKLVADLFPEKGTTAVVLGVWYQLGLLFLMFLAGGEFREGAPPGRRKTVLAVTIAGLVVPFGAGLAVARLLDHAALSGPRGNATTFALVFGIAIAVTSIPVISRIMLDLGILNTLFARMVLSVAVL